MTLADNQKRCSECGRIKPANPTRHQAMLHDLGHQLDDAVISKGRWIGAYHSAKRAHRTLQALEAQDEINDWSNEIDRLVYYIELCQQAIDKEAKLK